MKAVWNIRKIPVHIENGTVDMLKDLESYVYDFDRACIVAWFADKVLFGNLEKGIVHFYNYEFKGLDLGSEHVLKMRVFNELSELHIWRSGNSFGYRYICDGAKEGQEAEYIDAEQVMLGNYFSQSEDNNEFYMVTEKRRGIKYLVPAQIFADFDETKEWRLVLNTRNYIGYNAVGQAGFVDCRFVSLELKEVV